MAHKLNQRIDRELFEAIKKQQEELSKQLNVKISFPFASKIWFNKKVKGVKIEEVLASSPIRF